MFSNGKTYIDCRPVGDVNGEIVNIAYVDRDSGERIQVEYDA